LQSSTTNVHSTAASVNTTLNGNASADTVNVLSTGADSNLLVNTGAGGDAVYLQTTGAGSFTSIRTGGGDDTIVAASNAAAGVTPGAGSLDGLNGVLDVDAGSGTANHLVLDNVTGTPSVNALFTTPVIGLLGRTTGLAPATIYHSASGGTYNH